MCFKSGGSLKLDLLPKYKSVSFFGIKINFSIMNNSLLALIVIFFIKIWGLPLQAGQATKDQI